MKYSIKWIFVFIVPGMCLAAESTAVQIVSNPNQLPSLQVTRPVNAPTPFDPTRGHSAADAAPGHVATGNAKAKGPAVDPTGVWKWTTQNRNGQPIENVLKVDVSKQGDVSGTLTDNFGEHPISNATVVDGVLTFTVKYHSPGRGDVPFTYTVNLDSTDLRIAIDRPDVTPAGKQAAKTRHFEAVATHTR